MILKKRVALIAALCLLSISCTPFGPSRERGIQTAIEQVKETMRVALPDVTHPEPYEYEDAGDCALVPGLNSTKESLRYQVQVPLPAGDDGVQRQARAIQHWVDKGATIRELPYRPGPPNEVNYEGGSIMAFSTGGRPDMPRRTAHAEFWIVATTPCIPKAE